MQTAPPAPETQDEGALLGLLRRALEYIQEGVLILEGELDESSLRIRYANRGFEQMTGYTAQEVLGRTPAILHGARTDRALLGRWKDELREKGQFAAETYYYRKDGSEFRAHWSVWPLAGADRAATHYVAIQREVAGSSAINSELRRHVAIRLQVEEEAQKLNEQLAHMARLSTLGEMAGRLAHELNQPLTAITNYAQGCANRLEVGQIENIELIRVLELIRKAALRAGGIVDRIREFVRRKGPQETEVRLQDIVQPLLDLIKPEVRQSGVRVDLQLPSDLPPVLVDQPQIEQVLVNLVRNALESMSDTPPELRVLAISAAVSGGREIEVAVCDRGRGLQGEAAERLFEPFFSTKPFGLGMGLPISRSILEWHGGRLWVDKNADRGACFRFTLPIHGVTTNGDGE